MSWEADKFYANVIAAAGSVAVILLWLAPVRDVWLAADSVYATRSTAKLATAFGFVAGTYNCVLWNMYMVTRLDTMTVPFLVNLAGFVLNASFVFCYWRFAVGHARRGVKLQFIVLTLVTVIAAIIWASTKDNKPVGYIAAGVNVLMLFGPLAAAKQIIKTRSTKGLPFPPLLLTLIASAVWFCYGLYLLEIPVMIPNGLGVIFGIIQISLFCWASRHEKKVIAPAEADDVSSVEDVFQSMPSPTSSVDEEPIRASNRSNVPIEMDAAVLV